MSEVVGDPEESKTGFGTERTSADLWFMSHISNNSRVGWRDNGAGLWVMIQVDQK